MSVALLENGDFTDVEMRSFWGRAGQGRPHLSLGKGAAQRAVLTAWTHPQGEWVGCCGFWS